MVDVAVFGCIVNAPVPLIFALIARLSAFTVNAFAPILMAAEITTFDAVSDVVFNLFVAPTKPLNVSVLVPPAVIETVLAVPS